MRFLWRWIKRLVLLVVLLAIGLAAPVVYVETMCRGDGPVVAQASILPPEHRRPESRTLMTWPEWHIVHAYDDYAEVIRTGDPHDYAFIPAVTGFWTSLCSLSQAAPAHGGFDGATKQMVYVIGVSFTAELALKAAYEETVGRLATLIRGPERAYLDDLSARQAAAYAAFLHQVPWYKWDFTRDTVELRTKGGDGLRDTERRLALGIEYGTKAAYARAIAAAVAQVGPDELTMRVIVRGLTPGQLFLIEGVTVMAERPEGIEIETPRYAAFTELARRLVLAGADFVEIAGNDDILYTATDAQPARPGALASLARQGNPGWRHLMLVKVADLGPLLRGGAEIEHIHDY